MALTDKQIERMRDDPFGAAMQLLDEVLDVVNKIHGLDTSVEPWRQLLDRAEWLFSYYGDA